MQPLTISPLLVMLGGAVAALVLGIFLPRARQVWIAALVLAVLAAAAALGAGKLAAPPGLVFDDSFAVDAPFLALLPVLLAAGAACILLSLRPFRRDAREAEYYVMLLFSILGAAALAGAHDVMEIVMGVLLTAVPSYALVAWRRSGRLAVEALLKYYLFGALLNIGLILGLVLFYGLSGSTTLGLLAPAGGGGQWLFLFAAVLVLAGLGFKGGYVPGHFWIPDTYEGTTVPVAAYLSVVPKAAAVLALARLVDSFPAGSFDWTPLLALTAAVTMTWGNLAAFRQDDIRRLLAYSTVAQAGYMLVAVAALPQALLALPALLFYFAAYAAANLGAFAVLGATGRFAIGAQRGLLRRQPWLAVAMLVALMSLTGLPPLAGFVGKLALFIAAWDAGLLWLAILGLVNSLLSLFYYLRVLTPMFVAGDGEAAGAPDAERPDPWSRAVAIAAAALSLLLGLGAFLLLDPALHPGFAGL